MFETLPSPSFATLLIVLRGALLIGAFWVFALAFTRWRRADERAMRSLQSQLERAFCELRSVHETVTVMSARLDALSERTDVEARLAPASPAAASRGYDLATRLARNGASADELTTTCGVTRHEAELLLRLHGAKRRESAPASRRTAPAQPEPMSDVAAAPPAPAQAPPPNGRKRGSLLSVVG